MGNKTANLFNGNNNTTDDNANNNKNETMTSWFSYKKNISK